MGHVILRLILLFAVGAIWCPAAAAVDRTEKHAEYGFSLERPSTFEARPVPPGTPGLILMYAPKDAPLDRAAPVTHEVHRFGLEGSPELAVQRWALETFRPAKLDPVRSVRVRYGRTPVRFHGTIVDEDGVERSLFIHGWTTKDQAVVFVGLCESAAWRREKRVFDRTAMSFRFFTQAEVDKAREKWVRHYRRTSLPHREARIDVASDLVEGWQIRDTKHSIILFHGASNAPVLEQIARNLVGVQRRFALDFPPDRPIDALSVVRVCRDRGEYLTYGGNPTTVGYFNGSTQELVLYDARQDRTQSMPDDHPTMQTLYHEACHQFLYHTASALSPHSWYDEGTAEFYSGSVLVRGYVKDVIGLDDRERFLRQPETQRRLPELEALLSMTQEQFYAEADVNYSMGYAFVRFLRTSEAAKAQRAWSALPTKYFVQLRTLWRREAESLALSGITAAKFSAATQRARSAALEATLDGIDLPELEAAFLRWVREPDE